MNQIDPTKITNYHLSHEEAEQHILWWCFAAGHNALSTSKGIHKFLSIVNEQLGDHEFRPFAHIRQLDELKGWEAITEILSQSGLGCWRIKSRTVRELAFGGLNLKTCSVEDLESIFGIGPKTARCFILHTREGARLAGLDVHILHFLQDQGISVPISTPTGKKYKILEQKFLELCDDAGKTPAEYDLMIWNKYSGEIN